MRTLSRPKKSPQQAVFGEERSSGKEIQITCQIEGTSTPYETRVRGENITLGSFKEKVFSQTGEFR